MRAHLSHFVSPLKSKWTIWDILQCIGVVIMFLIFAVLEIIFIKYHFI